MKDVEYRACHNVVIDELSLQREKGNNESDAWDVVNAKFGLWETNIGLFQKNYRFGLRFLPRAELQWRKIVPYNTTCSSVQKIRECIAQRPYVTYECCIIELDRCTNSSGVGFNLPVLNDAVRYHSDLCTISERVLPDELFVDRTFLFGDKLLDLLQRFRIGGERCHLSDVTYGDGVYKIDFGTFVPVRDVCKMQGYCVLHGWNTVVRHGHVVDAAGDAAVLAVTFINCRHTDLFYTVLYVLFKMSDESLKAIAFATM
ncbi:hypothetical protein ElyMa_005790700 [Elysia marginata]|uniref:Uncharacterized protein n=1 Tax=Elysia marginata TaxID=1093978 RepID=A0AAV4FUM2_9GAST|nr:hypothetical protein ElyMa_005790700 [Elysia marginata]